MFQTIFVQPVLNALVALYLWVPPHDLGVAVILLTFGMRLLLWPLFVKSFQSQAAVAKMKPELDAIQKKYRKDPATQSREIMQLYRRHGFNPFMSFFALLVQLPILFALYRVLMLVTKNEVGSMLYPGLTLSGPIHPLFLGAFNLFSPILWLTVLAAAAQGFQSVVSARMTPAQPSGQAGSFASQFSRTMLFTAPVITFFILQKLPSVIALYWVVTAFVSAVQQQWVMKQRIAPAVPPIEEQKP